MMKKEKLVGGDKELLNKIKKKAKPSQKQKEKKYLFPISKQCSAMSLLSRVSVHVVVAFEDKHIPFPFPSIAFMAESDIWCGIPFGQFRSAVSSPHLLPTRSLLAFTSWGL